MSLPKYFFIVLLSFMITGCVIEHRVMPDQPITSLGEDEAYLSLVIDTLDNLRNIQLLEKSTGRDFYVGSVEKGISQITLRVPEGEYCFIGFDVWKLRVDYKNKGFCTYAEAGELNYFSEFVVRNPVTTIESNFPRFAFLLNKDHPQICKEFIGEACQQ